MNKRFSADTLSSSPVVEWAAPSAPNVFSHQNEAEADVSISRLEHPFAVRPDADLDESTAQDVALCRQLSALAVVLIFGFWAVYRLVDPTHLDPLWGRALFALVPGGLVLSSYVSTTVRRHFITAWRFFLHAAVVWFTGLSVLNAFDPSYGLGMLFMVAATSAGFGVGLRRCTPLIGYLAWTVVVPSGAVLAVPNPGIGRLLFVVSLLSLAVIFYLILNWRIQVENALRQRRKQAQAASRLKTTIIGNLNHEFRTPLTSILGFAESLEKELSGPEHHQAVLIRRSASRLQRTLDTLLELSRLRADQVELEAERLDVVAHVTEAVEPFVPQAEEQKLDLRLETPSAPLEAFLNPDALERIVTVLVDNALKFTEEGSVTVRVRARDETVLLSVTDTGIGIDEEARQLLFEPFRQASEGFDRTEEGLGLGLTLVGQLVELMEGRIEVESEPGTGTRFEVRVPRSGRPTKDSASSLGATS